MKKIKIRYYASHGARPTESIGFFNERKLKKATLKTVRNNKGPTTIDEVMENLCVVEKNSDKEGLKRWTVNALFKLVKEGKLDWDYDHKKDGYIEIQPNRLARIKEDTRYWPKR